MRYDRYEWKQKNIVQITNTEPQVQPKKFRNRYIMGLGKCSLSWRPHIGWEKHTFYSESTKCLSRKYQPNFRKGEPIPPGSLTAHPWKMVVGRLLSYWEGNTVTFPGKLLALGRVDRSTTFQGQKKVKMVKQNVQSWRFGKKPRLSVVPSNPRRAFSAPSWQGESEPKKIVPNLPKRRTNYGINGFLIIRKYHHIPFPQFQGHISSRKLHDIYIYQFSKAIDHYIEHRVSKFSKLFPWKVT